MVIFLYIINMFKNKNKLKKGILKKVALVKKANFFGKHFQTTFSCTLKHNFYNKEIEFYTEQVDFKKQPKKKKIFSALLLTFNFLLIIGIFTYYFSTNDLESFATFIKGGGFKWRFLILAFCMLLVSILLETTRYTQLIYKCTGKFRPFLGLKTHILGKYYDNITPFASGGQPFQIYYLNKHNIKGEHATSIPLVKHLINTVAFILISIIVLILNFFTKITTSPLLIAVAITSCIINGSLIAIILLFSISKRIGPSIIIKVLKFLNKLKIIKNYKVTFFKVSRFVKNYQKSVKKVAKSWKTLVLQFIISLLIFASFYSIVYFIYLAFITSATIGLFYIISCMVLCDLCGNIMPLPGGSGAIELSFDAVMGVLFVTNPGALPFAMLIWKLLTYFTFIFFGEVLSLSSSVKARVKESSKAKLYKNKN